jgi:DNA polymerase III epsilon subunit-like protein
MSIYSFVFDTETTGLVGASLLPTKHQPKVTEIYGCLLEDGRKVDEIEFFANPGEKLDPKVVSITGITDAMLANEKPFSAYESQVWGIIKRADEVVAHNLSFDIAIVDAEFARLGQSVPWPAGRICTVEATEWIKGYRLSLGALHEHLFGEKFAGAHRARVDVEALTRCFLELRRLGYV